MKIDIFPHIYPKEFFNRIASLSGPGLEMQKRFSEIPVLTDLDLRFRIMDGYDGYVHCRSRGQSLDQSWRARQQ